MSACQAEEGMEEGLLEQIKQVDWKGDIESCYPTLKIQESFDKRVKIC